VNIIAPERFKTITEKFKNVEDILVVGDVGLDYYIYGNVDRISPEAPVPVLRVTKQEQKLGMAANICHNVYSLGGKSSLISIIGEDSRGKTLQKLMNDEGVNLDQLVVKNDVTTISKERILTSRQQICRVDYEDERPSFSTANLNNAVSSYEKKLNDINYVILEDYSKGLFTEKTTGQFIQKANQANKFVAVDPGRGKPAHFYKGASLLKPNLSEARELVHSLGYSSSNVGDMINILVDKLELDMVAITLGPEGLALFDSNIDTKASVIPTVATEVFDVSGAGDTVIATMTMALSSGASLIEAGVIANIAAGVVVSKSGTATVNMSELNSYYEYIKNKN
jgi:rfaE bifunctional protein kinase chain/domain